MPQGPPAGATPYPQPPPVIHTPGPPSQDALYDNKPPAPAQPPASSPSFPELPELPSVPRSNSPLPPGASSAGGENVDFDDLTRRFEDLKKRK